MRKNRKAPTDGETGGQKREANNKKFDFWIGLAIPLIVNLGVAAIWHPGLVLGWIGQWVYVIPAALILQARRRVNMAQGLWIMAGAYALINLALCGYILSAFHG